MARQSTGKYLRGTYEQLDLIDKDMQLTVGQSLSEYVWERVLKPWVEESPNLDSELLITPPKVEINELHYWIRTPIEGKRYSFGMYKTKKELNYVLDYLSFKGFPKELSSTYCKLRGDKYREWLKEQIKNDEEYSKDGGVTDGD